MTQLALKLHLLMITRVGALVRLRWEWFDKEQTINNSKITTEDVIEAIDDIISDCKDNSLDFSWDDEDHYGEFERETDFTQLEII